MEHINLVVWTHYDTISDRPRSKVTLVIGLRMTKKLSWNSYDYISYSPWLTGEVSAEDKIFPLRTYRCLRE